MRLTSRRLLESPNRSIFADFWEFQHLLHKAKTSELGTVFGWPIAKSWFKGFLARGFQSTSIYGISDYLCAKLNMVHTILDHYALTRQFLQRSFPYPYLLPKKNPRTSQITPPAQGAFQAPTFPPTDLRYFAAFQDTKAITAPAFWSLMSSRSSSPATQSTWGRASGRVSAAGCGCGGGDSGGFLVVWSSSP